MAPHQTPTALQDEERSTRTSPDPSDRLCFFYGSLMDSGHIASVLDLVKEPDLRPARIHGYRTMQKGPFPALVRANNSAVSGMVYRRDSEADVEDQIAGLSNYEGESYGRHRVPIRFGDGSLEWGWTFIWIGDEKELREGAWDLEAWQRLWGRRNTVVSESPPVDRYAVEEAPNRIQ
ncbi:MAG: hypothetical protein LQ349_007425 [Xanthoria aureola]|nr:MAG: hypothetical protein LQ349_007425 [Xanthoria aureola]